MRGEKASFLAVVLVFIALSAYLSYSGNQAIAATPPEICKISGEMWDYAANANLPPFDCCTGFDACTDGYCCEARITGDVVTGHISGKILGQPVKDIIYPSPEPVGVKYACYNDADCGTNVWTGSLYCNNGDVYQNYRTYTCENPGTASASCTHSDITRMKENCGDDFYGSWNTYCKGDDVWKSRTVTERGCLDGYCFTNTGKSEKIVKTCSGCSGGDCIGETLTTLSYDESGSNEEASTPEPETPEYTCYQNSDCGTNQWIGSFYCKNGDVYQDYRTYTCHSPGTASAYCTYVDIGRIIEECEDSCEYGSCVTTFIITSYACYQNSDCGTDGWLGQEYCCSGAGENHDLCDTWRTYTCVNPGTPSAYCTHTDEDKIKQNCGDTSYGSWSNPYCSDDDVYHSRSVTYRGCDVGGCYQSTGVEEEKLEECGAEGCTDGQCNSGSIECYDDSDCSADAWVGNPYCNNGDVWQTWRDWSCQNPGTTSSDCVYTDQSQKKQDCGDNGCTNGQCNGGTDTHNVCDYSAQTCKSVNGAGTDECSVYSDCTHTECNYNTNTCDTVNGAGTDECVTWDDCGGNGNSDLTVTNLRVMWPPNPVAGDIITFEFIIKNIGSEAANNIKFKLLKGTGSNWSPPNPINLDPGQQIYVSHDYTYSNAGNYQITVIVDPNNQIQESNENNNRMSIIVIIFPSAAYGADINKGKLLGDIVM